MKAVDALVVFRGTLALQAKLIITPPQKAYIEALTISQVACANPGLPRLEGFGVSDQFPCPNSGVEMPVSEISFYRGGTVDNVTPLAKKMKAVLLQYGVAYRVSGFQTVQNVGEWMVVVQYADWMAYAKLRRRIALPTIPNTGKWSRRFRKS